MYQWFLSVSSYHLPSFDRIEPDTTYTYLPAFMVDYLYDIIFFKITDNTSDTN